MSDLPPLDLRAEIARIDRDRAETNKLFEEATKLAAERHKLTREAEKFRAEEHKLWRDWTMAPWWLGLTLIASIIGGLIGRHL